MTLTKLALATALTAPLLVSGAWADGHKPGEGKTVRPIIQPLLEEVFQHRVLFRALEDLGYEVAEPQEVYAQTLHLALATGDADFSAVHWQSIHKNFYEEAGGSDTMTKLGVIIDGALQGYLVSKDAYDAGLTNIGQLKDPEIAKQFDSDGDGKADLAGCVPGWGCERIIEHQLDAFDLRGTVNHNQGEYNAIIADTIARNQAGEPVLYYTWTPYWVSGVLVPGENVEWLSVPFTSLPEGQDAETSFDGKNLGFPVEKIYSIANNDFLADNPAAGKLLEMAQIDINDISAQNKLIADGEDSSRDIDRHVADWIEKNRETYDSWLAAARAAAK